MSYIYSVIFQLVRLCGMNTRVGCKTKLTLFLNADWHIGSTDHLRWQTSSADALHIAGRKGFVAAFASSKGNLPPPADNPLDSYLKRVMCEMWFGGVSKTALFLMSFQPALFHCFSLQGAGIRPLFCSCCLTSWTLVHVTRFSLVP